MADKKKKKKNQMPSHVGLKSKLNAQREYTNYRASGGQSDFNTWQTENK